MLRSIACLLTLFVLGPTAFGADISDAKNDFRVTIPEGWTSETQTDSTLALVVSSPRKAETGGNCNVVAEAIDGTRALSQSEVEKLFLADFKEDDWKAAIGNMKGLKSTTIEKWGERAQRGRKVLFIKATLLVDFDGVEFTLAQLQDFHVIPGRVYAVTCAVLAAGYDREASDFEAIMASFVPAPELTIAAVQPGAPLSFGSNPRFAAGQRATSMAGIAIEASAARAGRR